MAKYGARLPLLIGPLIAAVGFLLFVAPDARALYWTGFFPAFVVLGLGMAVSIAPLTTVVMNSVEQERVGIASGINNAVARVAGVLAIAVLGIVMLASFSHSLRNSLASLNLKSDVVHELESNVGRLGDLQAPASVDWQTAVQIRAAVMQGFVYGFRVVMLICALLAVASAAVAWRKIPAR